MNERGRKKARDLATSLFLSVIISLAFYLGTTVVDGTEGVDLIGGTVYTFVLSLIIFLALVPRTFARFSRGADSTRV